MGCFNFFLEFFFEGVSLVRPSVHELLNSWEARSEGCKSAVARTKLFRRNRIAVSYVFLSC